MKKLFSILAGILAVGSASAQNDMNTYTYKLGEATVTLLSEGQQQGNGSILIGATPEMTAKYIPDNTFPNASNAFLIRTPDKNILIDTGFGRRLFDNLQSSGVTPEEIDILLITHMHGDHIGGMLRNGEAAFPNAELYLPQPEYDYWTSTTEMNRLPENKRGNFLNAQQVITAYKEKLHLFQPVEIGTSATPLLPGIQGIAAYGHTPGHTLYMVESGNDKLLIWADLTHAMAIQMPCPQVAVTYDIDPEKAIASRKKVLKYVAENHIPIAGMHIAFPGIGNISENTAGSYVFTPANE